MPRTWGSRRKACGWRTSTDKPCQNNCFYRVGRPMYFCNLPEWSETKNEKGQKSARRQPLISSQIETLWYWSNLWIQSITCHRRASGLGISKSSWHKNQLPTLPHHQWPNVLEMNQIPLENLCSLLIPVIETQNRSCPSHMEMWRVTLAELLYHLVYLPAQICLAPRVLGEVHS